MKYDNIKIIVSLFGYLSPRCGDLFVDAFVQRVAHGPTSTSATDVKSSQLFATKYVVIGGNIDGINNEDDDTYNMSKKERRRREREAGEEAFKSGEYKKKKKKKKFTINYDKLEEKVTKERPVLPREMKSEVKSNLGVPSKRGNKKKTAVEKKLSVKAIRLQKQRTAGGTLDSSRETILPQEPEKQAVQIRIAKRANKTITMVQGMMHMCM